MQQESFAAASLFADTFSAIPFVRPKPVLSPTAIAAAKDALAADNEEDDLYATAPKRKLVAQGNGQASLVVEPSVENGADEQGVWRWLATVTPTGNLEVSCFDSRILDEADSRGRFSRCRISTLSSPLLLSVCSPM